MVRHISVFFLSKNCGGADREKLLQCLADFGPMPQGAEAYAAGADCLPRPPRGIPGLPEFGDAVQCIDFVDPDTANAYPESEAHQNLIKTVGALLEKVVSIDIQL